MRRKRITQVLMLAVALIMATVLPGFAQSSTKSFSTNFTLVNLSGSEAHGVVQYVKSDGSPWKTADDQFTLAPNGGQAIYRQYTDGSLSAGQGSGIVSADQPVGAVVQIRALNQDPTSNDAYIGIGAPDSTWYVPLVARKANTASGTANSQIIVQNAGTTAASVTVDLVDSTGVRYQKPINNIPGGASSVYDLAQESSSNVPDNWFGSAVVRGTSGAQVVVISNFFTGNAMQTFNGFGQTAPGNKWYVPLFTARLSNSLSTVITMQNLSGGTITAEQVSVDCTPLPGTSGSPFTVKNSAEVLNNASYSFNPVTDMNMPAGFAGSCVLDSSAANVVVFVQMRFVATGEAASYQAIKAGGTDTKVIVPLIAKRLSNGFASTVVIQNLSNTPASVNLTYTPSAEYVSGGGSSTPITFSGVTIPAQGSIQQNQRVADGVAGMSDGWVGTLVVQSVAAGGNPVAAINGFVQLSFLRTVNPSLPQGDNYMAHNAFTQP